MKNTGFTILFYFILLSCNAQGSKKNVSNAKNKAMTETIDFSKLEKQAVKTPISATEYTYEFKETLGNGTIVTIDGSKAEGGFVERNILPPPSFATVYKEFYSNGAIKKKETNIGEYVKVGISTYYDESGNSREVDEDKKFGKIKPEDALRFLAEKGVINLKTGAGRFDQDGRPTFELHFNNENGKKYFVISVLKGKPNTPENFPDIGEPPAYVPRDYKMDGETGKVEEIN